MLGSDRSERRRPRGIARYAPFGLRKRRAAAERVQVGCRTEVAVSFLNVGFIVLALGCIRLHVLVENRKSAGQKPPQKR